MAQDYLEILNNTLSSYDSASSGSDNFGLGQSLFYQLDNYDLAPVFVAPTDSNTIGATGNYSDSGQSILAYFSGLGMRIGNAVADKIVAQEQSRTPNTVSQNAPGAVNKGAKSNQNLLILAGLGFVVWKILED